MRIVGVDFGQRRLGLAVSDATGMLARPWQALSAGPSPLASAESVAVEIASLQQVEAAYGTDQAVGAVVVGLPRRLGGEDTGQSQPARDFARHLAQLTGLPVHLQDERLSSREAESRLAVREKNWRRRKEKLDAASAAVILQDYLDAVH